MFKRYLVPNLIGAYKQPVLSATHRFIDVHGRFSNRIRPTGGSPRCLCSLSTELLQLSRSLTALIKKHS